MKPRPTQIIHVVGMVVLTTGIFGGCVFGACQTIPREWIQQAETGATLTSLSTHPERYQNKILILGGTPVTEIHSGDRLWIRMRNRPLDSDYQPHRPLVHGGTEDGHYWVLVDRRDFAATVHRWARVTVVGRVITLPSSERTQLGATPEPVLTALYMQGWPLQGTEAESWQAQRDPQYLDPRGLMVDPFQGPCWICRSPYGGEQ